MKPPQEIAGQIIAKFKSSNDWEERYRLLLEFGRIMPAFPEEERIETNRIYGCQSNVWLKAWSEDGRIYFLADSDSAIVLGLIGVLYHIYAGQHCNAVSDFDVETVFDDLGFGSQLLVGRRNGLVSIAKVLRGIAVPGSEDVGK